MTKRAFNSVGRVAFLLALALGWSFLNMPACGAQSPEVAFEISFTEGLHPDPITGRVFLAINTTDDPEPRIAAYQFARQRVARVPFFGVDVDQLRAGQPAVINANTPGFPYESLRDLPAGDYYVQAVLNVFTQFHRSDGHVIWAHMDQWEGQRWAFSPGNLMSEPQRVHLDPREGYKISLTLTQVIPPIEVPEDTKWVRRIKIQSELLTEFWGHPIYIGATILLPKGYDQHPDAHYPVIYNQGHFGMGAPFGFNPEPPSPSSEITESRAERTEDLPSIFDNAKPWYALSGNPNSGYEFYQLWTSDNLPRMIAVTFQDPTPFFDDSYAVNSANNGPYADALLTELIPHLEANFRMIPESYARVLTGGSTGGWRSLALQVHYPEFFGGAWISAPDPIDFRRYQLVNIYEDESAFLVPNTGFNDPHMPGVPERMFQMSPEGQPLISIREDSRLEEVTGTKGRSSFQIDGWNAAYGPVGDDGYPRRLWDFETGEIDREVAYYMRDNGYDLSHYIRTNWSEIGPHLVGKLHFFCGDMDDFYLSFAVYILEDFLENTFNPYYEGDFTYGRPMKGHGGWRALSNEEMIRQMADQIAKNAPIGADTHIWR